MLFLQQEQKMMDLMMILYRHENEWMTYGELAKILQCSKKTLASYLAALKNCFQRLSLLKISALWFVLPSVQISVS
ncbi:helix-turn-helix domain-containing protein [Peptococcus niger]|uniref:M protein trans-acting positive regulator (MGA) HTH domain-containing protein n=1 Tax=Peptococcus niger TaxID=2741 RepID=A0A1G6XXY0_PEPNI|nr:helix-turn-helix domain-containing protein [Peptococcus niger]SDD82255.1 M protein trans-acting positive regulator (MGA) HTH domain-containing protein [Peptococcus niger]